uniref:Uncharacterized protein n=1 Tax=Crocodylus porosus TaxID=8502 RepID=A0A7M4FPZ6_CROPO
LQTIKSYKRFCTKKIRILLLLNMNQDSKLQLWSGARETHIPLLKITAGCDCGLQIPKAPGSSPGLCLESERVLLL